MARRNRVREQALADAKAAERRASNKITRNEAADRHIRGTEFDPRAGFAQLANMGTRELRAHTRTLNQFNSRETQFTGLFGGRAVPRSMWNMYKQLEESQNEIARQTEARVRNIKLPGQDQTIGQYIGSTQAGNQAAANQQSRIFHTIRRDAATIVDAASLGKLIEQMRQKNDPNYLKDAVDRRMNSVYALLNGSGMRDRIEQIQAMSVEEKQALLDYSTFSELARERFGSGKDEEDDQDRIDEDWRDRGEDRDAYVREQMDEVISWIRENVASELAATNSRSGKSRTKRTRRSRNN